LPLESLPVPSLNAQLAYVTACALPAATAAPAAKARAKRLTALLLN